MDSVINHYQNLLSLKNELILSDSSEDRDKLSRDLIKEVEVSANEVISKKFRTSLGYVIVATFICLNLFVVCLVGYAFYNDIILLTLHSEYVRLIDSETIITLIFGVISETALAFGLLAGYVFNPKKYI